MSECRKVSKEEQNLLSEHFMVDGQNVVCKKAYSNVHVGKIMAAKQARKHRKTMYFNGKFYPLHRVVYFLSSGFWPSGVVDHINGDPFDNRPENLRDVSQSLNIRSYCPSHKGSTSRFRGVHWFKRYRNWQAQIMCCGEKYHLGYFDSEYEAALVWNYKAHELGFNKETFNRVFEDVEVEYGE